MAYTPASMSLFRPEALAAQSAPAYGPILIARSWASWMGVTAAGCLAVAVVAYLCLGTYTRRTTLAGVLVPSAGSIRVIAPTSGVVVEKRVQEGQAVQRGDVLFVLADLRQAAGPSTKGTLAEVQSLALEQRRASIQRALEATATLQGQTDTGLRLRLTALRDQLRQTAQEVELQARRVQAAARMLERQQVLARDNFISEAALQDKQDQLELLQAQHLTAQRQHAELSGNASALESELQQSASRSASQTEALRRDLAALDQESAELDTRGRQLVLAPENGIVTAITAQVGQQTNGAPLAVLLPAGAALVAQVFAPPRAMGFVTTGQRVRIRYQAWPWQKFGQYEGTVREVSRSPISPSELSSTLPLAFTAADSVFRITVHLDRQQVTADGQPVPLVAGMTLDADVEQETRRLIEWVLEPLAGLQRHIF